MSSSIIGEKYKTYLDYKVVTNSDYLMSEVLKSSDLCNIGGYWIKYICENNGMKMIPVKGCEKALVFGYIKYIDTELDEYHLDFINYVNDLLKNDIK